jgi:hypothetical protein
VCLDLRFDPAKADQHAEDDQLAEPGVQSRPGVDVAVGELDGEPGQVRFDVGELAVYAVPDGARAAKLGLPCTAPITGWEFAAALGAALQTLATVESKVGGHVEAVEPNDQAIALSQPKEA